MTEPILACEGCGRTKTAPTGDPTDLHPATHCSDCPPWTCDSCGETCSMATPCSCWITLDGLNTAHIKAIFAADGTFDVKPVIQQ